MLKIDLQKAYDSVEWDYLEKVMCGLGFPEIFVKWIMKCVTTVNYSIVVNGQTSKSFDAAKGLRQGDPISPFLFAIAMEYLNDLLLFARGDLDSVKAMQLCFSQFSQASGLQANLSKSSIYCGGV
ncbi:secreted RxLR effector protein 78-like [Solanum lycopersicum]|uniref:secreted RxLR effector protein 78-like n=1 Tax=Solanum lycopersicum TaxID=4081 RepID=UPI00374A0071